MYAHKVYRGFESLSLRHLNDMSYLVLARRFRPGKFEEVIGQEHVTRTLKNALISGRLAHAFLFAGTRGVGKTSVARILAKAINCLAPSPEAPCNQCPSCLEINDGVSVDVQEIDGASNRGIDEVRELRQNVRYLPAKAKIKVYIIDEVHMLTGPAFNALLKTLEEPPEHVIFIFATTEVHKVPATILSRCQSYDFRPLPPGLIMAQLQKIAAQEGIDLSQGAAAMLARAAKGSLRDGLSLFDQAISFAGRQISEEQAQQILGAVDPRLAWQLIRAVLRGEADKVLAGVAEVVETGFDLRNFYHELMANFRNLVVLKADPAAAPESLGLSPAETAELTALAEETTAESLQVCLHGLLEAERLLRATTQPRFTLELALLKLCHLVPVTGLEQIIAKLDGLHRRLTSTPETETFSPPLVQTEPKRPAGPKTDLESDQSQPSSTSGLLSPPAAPEDRIDPLTHWPLFLDHVKAANPRLASFLDQTQPQSVDRSRLVLEQASSFDFLADEDRRQSLENLAAAFFGRRYTLKLVRGKNFSANDKYNDRRQLDQVASSHPLVKAASELFDGQPVEIKPSTR